MFEIEYKGANCLIISTKKGKIVVDPKLSIVGLKDLSIKDSIELVTEHRFIVGNSDSNLIIDSPGDYGVAELDIHGVAARRHIDTESDGKMSTMYRLEIGDIKVGIIGNIYEKLSDEQLEDLGLIDILILPVGGGGYTLDADGAAGLVRDISPKIVIPIHYADQSIKYEVPQDELSHFVSELSAPVEIVPKFKLKQLTIAPAPLSVIEITRS